MRLCRVWMRSIASVNARTRPWIFTIWRSRPFSLLESNEQVYQETRLRFDHVLMDELQDTNRLQWRLVNLVRRNFFAVGDINQSIYGFRHADPQVFAGYRTSVEAQGAVDQLNENYRSRAEILATVETAFEGSAGH